MEKIYKNTMYYGTFSIKNKIKKKTKNKKDLKIFLDTSIVLVITLPINFNDFLLRCSLLIQNKTTAYSSSSSIAQ